MPRSRTVGFGTGRGTEGVVVSPDILKEQQNPDAAAAEYLREIRDRYCQNAGCYPQQFNLAASTGTKFDCSQTEYNAVAITVVQGVAWLFLGDFTSGTPPNSPHFVVSAAIGAQSQVFPLPPGPYVFTVFADNTATAIGCITPMAL